MFRLKLFLAAALVLMCAHASHAFDNSYELRYESGGNLTDHQRLLVSELQIEIDELYQLNSTIKAEKEQLEKEVHFIARIAKADQIDISVKPNLKSQYLYIMNMKDYAFTKYEIDQMEPNFIQRRVDSLLVSLNNLDEELQNNNQHLRILRQKLNRAIFNIPQQE